LEWDFAAGREPTGRFVEQIVDRWVYLRRFDRVYFSDDGAAQAQAGVSHIGDSPPLVTRCVVEAVARNCITLPTACGSLPPEGRLRLTRQFPQPCWRNSPALYGTAA
jgi:hypothetical protein